MTNERMTYNRVFYDMIRPIRAVRPTDVPVVFAGTIGKYGAELKTVQTTKGEMKMASFEISIYYAGKNVSYAVGLTGCSKYAYHAEKYDCFKASAWQTDAEYVSSLQPGQQIFGGGILRVSHEDGKEDEVELVISGLAKLIDNQREPDANGRYPKVVYDNIRPILNSRPSDIPVVFTGTISRFGVTARTITNTKGETVDVSSLQVDFYNQKPAINSLTERLGCQKIAYTSDRSDSIRAAAWSYDAKTAAELYPGDNLIGGGIMRVNHSDKYGDQTELQVYSVFKPISSMPTELPLDAIREKNSMSAEIAEPVYHEDSPDGQPYIIYE